MMTIPIRKYTCSNPIGCVAKNKTLLWASAEKLRSNLEASDYKHIVLGLIGLKYVVEFGIKYGIIVDKSVLWSEILNEYNGKNIGTGINNSIITLEKDNEKLEGIFPRVYDDPDIDQEKLFSLFGIFHDHFTFDSQSESDSFGEVYEYFLGKFAEAEGRRGGEYFTPREVVELMVKCLSPESQSSIYDPCCGSGGIFVQCDSTYNNEKAMKFYGQEAVGTTWRICKMNMIVRGLDVDLGQNCADTFTNDIHRDKKFDYIITNPPFNLKEWGGPFSDERWSLGTPSKGNANFAWIQHIIHHLNNDGKAAFVMTNSLLSSDQRSAIGVEVDSDSEDDYGPGALRRELIKLGVVDAIIRLPSKLFTNTPIPASIWLLDKEKLDSKRPEEILMIDLRDAGKMVSKKSRVIAKEEVDDIVGLFWRWKSGEDYSDIQGKCKSVYLNEIADHRFALVPGRYVGYSADKRELAEVSDYRENLAELCDIVEDMQDAWGDSILFMRGMIDG